MVSLTTAQSVVAVDVFPLTRTRNFAVRSMAVKTSKFLIAQTHNTTKIASHSKAWLFKSTAIVDCLDKEMHTLVFLERQPNHVVINSVFCSFLLPLHTHATRFLTWNQVYPGVCHWTHNAVYFLQSAQKYNLTKAGTGKHTSHTQTQTMTVTWPIFTHIAYTHTQTHKHAHAHNIYIHNTEHSYLFKKTTTTTLKTVKYWPYIYNFV